MSLTPEQIVAEEFRLRARGYDRDEVDAYLDRLADQVEADAARVRAVEERLFSVEADLDAARERETTLTRTLATVQDAADRARADAEAEVAALRAETESELSVAREQAQQEAERVRADARHEAEQVRADARREAEQVRADAQQEAADLRSLIAEVQQLDASHRAQLRGHLQAQLDALDALPDPYPGLQARLAPATDTAETATPGPWGFQDPVRTAETADVTPEPPSEDDEDISPGAGRGPSDPTHGPGDPDRVPDPSPAVSASDEHTEDGPEQDPHASDTRASDLHTSDPLASDPNTSDPRSEDVPGDDTDARDPQPDAPGDRDPDDGDDSDDGDDPWRRRDERGQPVEPDPPIWG